jgi:hypothetical protein
MTNSTIAKSSFVKHQSSSPLRPRHLPTAGILHPFTARAFLGVVVIVWAFLALLPYCKESAK